MIDVGDTQVRCIDFEEVLMRSEDLQTNSYFWLRCPYILDKEIANSLISRCRNERGKVVKQLKDKHGIELPSRETLEKWGESGIIPLPIVCLFGDKIKFDVFLRCKGFTNRNTSSIFRPPRTYAGLNNVKLLYLGGCVLGDGSLASAGSLNIYDGHPNKACVGQSKRYVLLLKEWFRLVFGIENQSMALYRRGNMWSLSVYSKWLGRFFNYFFEVPYGPKNNCKISPVSIFSRMGIITVDAKAAFYRGLLDTDGSIHPRARQIMLTMQNKEILDDLLIFVSQIKIKSAYITKISHSYQLRIGARDFRKFANVIGFEHPRKKAILQKRLNEQAFLIEYKGVDKSHLIDNNFDLLKIKGIRIIGGGKFLRRTCKQQRYTLRDAASQLGVSAPTLSERCAGRKSIPLNDLWSLFKQMDSSKSSFYQALADEGARYKVSGRGGGAQSVSLPMRPCRKLLKTAEKIRPVSNYRIHLLKSEDSKKTLKDIEELFGASLAKKNAEGRWVINSRILNEFFRKFFVYER